MGSMREIKDKSIYDHKVAASPLLAIELELQNNRMFPVRMKCRSPTSTWQPER